MNSPARPRIPAAAALYLAVVQFVFAACWTVYVVYLPDLVETAGIPRRYAIYVLMLDQLVFMATDVAMGMAADRVARLVGRLGVFVLVVTAVSCGAFLLIPQAAAAGTHAPLASLCALLAWTATSSALRAPPWVLLGRYAAAPAVPWLNALMLTGVALAGALAPYLGIALRNVDPRVPFAVSSLALLATVAGLVPVERMLARQPAAPERTAASLGGVFAGSRLFLAGALVLALGFQVHFSLNSAGQYLRFARAEELQFLMPVFWIGFNLAMFPGAALARRHGALPVIAGAALAGAAATLVSARADALAVLIAAQLAAGGAWGCVMMAGFTAALELGRSGREGLALGLLFAALAFATLARMAGVAWQVDKLPGIAPMLGYAPFVLWCAGAAAFLALCREARPRPPPRSA